VHRINRLFSSRAFDANNAIARVMEIKAWQRQKKIALIAANDQTWGNLARDWEKPVAMSTADCSGLSARLEDGASREFRVFREG
jgi:hypothetical protein